MNYPGGLEEKSELSVVRVYERFRCPAEVVLPYRIPGAGRSLLRTWGETRFKKSLWNMDFPWILVMGTSLFGTVLAAFVCWIVGCCMAGGAIAMSAALSMGVLAAFPIVFALCSPLMYPLSVIVNLRAGYGKNWTGALLGPTHIGITDSGFKFYVRGFFFYNFPNLAIWQEVFDADLVADELYKTISLRFIYQTGFGRTALYLPLSGFANVEDVRLVLGSFAENVPIERQGDFMKKMAEVKFGPLLHALEKNNLLDLGIYHPDTLSGLIPSGEGIKQALLQAVNSELEKNVR